MKAKSGKKSAGVGSDGKQTIKKGTDCGATAMFTKTDSPESVKETLGTLTPYKHR